MSIPVILSISCMAVVVTGINLFCLVVIRMSDLMRRPGHLAITALIIAHLIQGIVVMPSYAVRRADILDDQYHRKILCDIFRFSYMFTNYCLCLTVLVITIDRVVAARFPLRYRHEMTRKRLFGVVIVVWIYVFHMCLIPFIPKDITKESSCHYNFQREWVMTMLFGHTLLPFILILCSYIYIFKKTNVWSAKRQQSLPSDKIGKPMLRRTSTKLNQQRTFKTCFIIVVCYALCWGPSFMYYAIKDNCVSCFPDEFEDSPAEKIIGLVVKLLTFLDGILAPMVYLATNASFKVSLLRLKKRFSQKDRTTTTQSYTRKNSSSKIYLNSI